MSNLCSNRVLRVNLTTGKISRESLDPKMAVKFIGGRGLATWYLRQEVEPTTDPLSPQNKVLLVSGPLTGTAAPASSRYMVVTKSPLNGGVACSNAGGFWGPELRSAGYDMLILEGRAARPAWLYIKDDVVELRDASACWGKLVSETTAILQQEAGDPKARVLTIGPAGEKCSPIAAVMNDRYRAAGRSGVGAVLGSKNLKAVVVRGSGQIKAAEPERAKDVVSRVLQAIRAHAVTGQGLPTYGTSVLVNVINEIGAYPTRNFQESHFKTADRVSGERLAETYLVKNTACSRCPIACGRHCSLDGVEGEGPEYETLWAYSANCGVDNLEAVIKANNWCNEYGLDTISAGATIACAMEMYQRGILTRAEIGGPPLEFGSGEAIVEWTRRMGAGEGFGDKLAQGSYRLAALYGVPELSMSVKRLELPAYDPRGVQGHGLQYATSNRGGCHVRGYVISAEVLGIPEPVDRFALEGKAALAKLFQDLTAVIDSLGLCLFTSFALKPDDYRDLYNAIAGGEWTTTEMLAAGERIWNLERLFNLAAGIDPSEDKLPKRLLSEPVPEGPSKGHVHRLAELLPQYYQERGWSPKGIPTPEKLAALELV
ncbi:MAG: aldehyde ferredoxin oxidoreductase family protein [Thermoguttaceae bacterium]